MARKPKASKPAKSKPKNWQMPDPSVDPMYPFGGVKGAKPVVPLAPITPRKVRKSFGQVKAEYRRQEDEG